MSYWRYQPKKIYAESSITATELCRRVLSRLPLVAFEIIDDAAQFIAGVEKSERASQEVFAHRPATERHHRAKIQEHRNISASEFKPSASHGPILVC